MENLVNTMRNTLWTECKEVLYYAEKDDDNLDCAVFCQSHALLKPQNSEDINQPPLNTSLINFLKHVRKEGYRVHVFSVSLNNSRQIFESRGVDTSVLPFEIESHFDLMGKYKGQRRGLLIADTVSKRKDDQPFVFWDITGKEVSQFLLHLDVEKN